MRLALAAAAILLCSPATRAQNLIQLAAESAAQLDPRGKAQKPADAPAAAASKRSEAEVIDDLYKRLIAHIQIARTDDVRRVPFVRSAIRIMLDSPSAREAAERMVAQGGPKVIIDFKDMDRNTIREENDVNAIPFSGQMAVTFYEPRLERAIIYINRLLLAVGHGGGDLAGPLAHEMLGHAVELQRAQKKGIYLAYLMYRDNETSANLLGWLTQVELGQKVPMDALWRLMGSKEKYYSEIVFANPNYARQLSREEMSDPTKLEYAYDERSSRVMERREQWERLLPRAKEQLKAINHFVNEHGFDPARFASLSRELTVDVEARIPSQIATQYNILIAITETAQHFMEKPSDKALISKMAGDPQFQEWEDIRDTREARLRALLRGRSHETEKPKPVAGQITTTEMKQLIDADRREHPDHWPDAPVAQ